MYYVNLHVPVETPSKGHFSTDMHYMDMCKYSFVLCREVILFPEVQNVIEIQIIFDLGQCPL